MMKQILLKSQSKICPLYICSSLLQWTSFFVLFNFAATDKVRYDEEFSASFEVVNIGRVETVIMWVEETTLWQCASTCMQHLQCESINYHEKTSLCELADRDFEEGWFDDSDKDWKNYASPKPVNGGFGEWVVFGECSQSCGDGVLIRRRFCNNPVPMYGGHDCIGNKSDERPCNMGECNLALHKPSTQSSTASNNQMASNANDGDTRTVAHQTNDRSCCWWKVDLLSKVSVKKMKLVLGAHYFKIGSFKELVIKTSLNGIEWIVCKYIGKPSHVELILSCDVNPTFTRYIKIENSEQMPLREVMVFGHHV